jgi:hypothetical protein
MIVKVNVFVQLDGKDIIDPQMLQRFVSKIAGELIVRTYSNTSLRFSSGEHEFLKQLGVKSNDFSFLTEEQALAKLK